MNHWATWITTALALCAGVSAMGCGPTPHGPDEAIDLQAGEAVPLPGLILTRAYAAGAFLDRAGVLLVLGGDTRPGQPNASSEWLDLEAGTRWEQGPTLSVARSRAGAIATPDGRGVLLVGGVGAKGAALGSLEVVSLPPR